MSQNPSALFSISEMKRSLCCRDSVIFAGLHEIRSARESLASDRCHFLCTDLNFRSANKVYCTVSICFHLETVCFGCVSLPRSLFDFRADFEIQIGRPTCRYRSPPPPPSTQLHTYHPHTYTLQYPTRPLLLHRTMPHSDITPVVTPTKATTFSEAKEHTPEKVDASVHSLALNTQQLDLATTTLTEAGTYRCPSCRVATASAHSIGEFEFGRFPAGRVISRRGWKRGSEVEALPKRIWRREPCQGLHLCHHPTTRTLF